MDFYNTYFGIIAICSVIVLSYGFNLIAKATNVPSVLLLIILGFVIRQGFDFLGIETGEVIYTVLELLGVVGLIMIVLEAALELEISKEKLPLIIKSFFVALVALLLSSFLIANLLTLLFDEDLYSAMVYAVPLAIMSSAIIIPSVGKLVSHKKEFLIYESTFSDILGIMLFFFIIKNYESSTPFEITLYITSNILITLIVSVLLSYILVWVLHKLGSQAKLMLLLALLVMLYAIGKMLHFSSLFIILIFGLILNNDDVFFRGFIRENFNKEQHKIILKEFNIITIESAFFVRTFFFVVFGMTLTIADFADFEAALVSLAIIALVLGVRYSVLFVFRRRNIFPELFIAPRGLITILLIFSIPIEYQLSEFGSAVILYTILIGTIIMAAVLIYSRNGKGPIEELPEFNFEHIDFEIRNSANSKED
jgi:NhaP-type Na+/H+ or K+/H+ antiporter